MFPAARPSRFAAIPAHYFAAHFRSFGFYSDDTLKDQNPRIKTGAAASKQSQP
jgi:hypothetical protein